MTGGSSITVGSSGLTLGGSGTYYADSPINSFISCGHGTSLLTNVYNVNTYIGFVMYRRYSGTEYGDFSIIAMDSNYSPASSVFSGGGNTINYTGYYYNPTEGVYLYKYGKNGGLAYCVVTGTCITVTQNGVAKAKGMTKAQCISGNTQNGDSGGPFRQDSSFCGVYHGSNSSGSTVNFFFTPYTYIYNKGFIIKTN